MKKYTYLSDAQLKSIARLAVQENGESVVGKEVSLMANLFELQSKYSNIYDFIRYGGWFHASEYYMDNGSASTKAVETTKDVLINGNRQFPAYIDEHDCFNDILSVSNNGKSFTKTDRSQYKKDVTIIKNKYNSTYTFYEFPSSGSDPFGYTAESYNKYKGQTDTSSSTSGYPKVPFEVKVNVSDLNIRSGPGTSNPSKGFTGIGIFTITEVQGDWGKLKSGAGWIYLGNSSYVTIKGTVKEEKKEEKPVKETIPLICQTKQEYIDKIAEAAQKACKKYGYLPSVLIAQSCLENGFGVRAYWDNPQIEALLKYNNMVGIKSELLNKSWVPEYSVWEGESLTKDTPEQYGNQMVTIKDNFRKYDTPERSFCDFLLFLTYASNYGKGGTPKYGKEVIDIKDPQKLIKEVAGRGYATGQTYPTSVMRIINENNLTKYDDLSKVKASTYIPDALKNQKKEETTKPAANGKKLGNRTIHDITAENRGEVPASRGSNKIEFIVIHYLGVPNADNPYLYGGGYGGHYNIQRNGEIYYAANPKTAVVWHCGGGLQGDGGHSFYKICTNYNSIGIECGVAADSSNKDLSGDSDLWYFTEETQESLVWLVSKLMDDYNISADHVIRHYDVTGKICPNPYVKNNNRNTSWTWDQFKANLAQYRKNGTITVPSGSSSGSSGNLKKGSKGEVVSKLQQMLTDLGYDIKGADGIFGANTETALKNFQKANGLSADGIYGPLTKAKLLAEYKKYKANKKKQVKFLDKVADVAEWARKNNLKYGDSRSQVPCDDGKISCDRLVARALYELGYTDQPVGGITCGHVESYLPSYGFTKVTKTKDIKPGAVVAVRYKNHNYIDHVFVIKSYDDKTGVCDKYETGSDYDIQHQQPFHTKLLEWGEDRIFVAAWNPPKNLS